MHIVYSDEFVKQFHKLPSDIQGRLREQEKIFQLSWRDSRLHVKKLKGERMVFSFRITRVYRVLFVFVNPNDVLFATIGHRKDVYR